MFSGGGGLLRVDSYLTSMTYSIIAADVPVILITETAYFRNSIRVTIII
jgi:hypothetical protein